MAVAFLPAQESRNLIDFDLTAIGIALAVQFENALHAEIFDKPRVAECFRLKRNDFQRQGEQRIYIAVQNWTVMCELAGFDVDERNPNDGKSRDANAARVVVAKKNDIYTK